MRERVREVMIFAGPRMLLRHPVLALLHLVVDERRPAPARPVQRAAAAGEGTAEAAGRTAAEASGAVRPRTAR
jgi:hypothetical protein